MSDMTEYTVTVPNGTSDSLWTLIFEAVDAGPMTWTSKARVGSPVRLRASVGMIEDIARQILAVFVDEGRSCPFRVSEAATYEFMTLLLQYDPQMGSHLSTLDEHDRTVATWDFLASMSDAITVGELKDRLCGRAWRDAWRHAEEHAVPVHAGKGA